MYSQTNILTEGPLGMRFSYNAFYVDRSAFNTSNEVVSSLKAELERCLISNRQKRAQVMELKDELKTIKKDLTEYKQRCERAELISEEQKVRNLY